MAVQTDEEIDDVGPGIARLLGGGQVVGGAVIAILALVLPAKLAPFVRACNTVGGYLYGQEHPSGGAKCAAANFVTDYKWFAVVFAAVIILEGTGLFFRDELKAILRDGQPESSPGTPETELPDTTLPDAARPLGGEAPGPAPADPAPGRPVSRASGSAGPAWLPPGTPPTSRRRRPRVVALVVTGLLAVLAVTVVVHHLRADRTETTPAQARRFAAPVTGWLPALLAGDQTIAVSVSDGHGGARRRYPNGRTYAPVTGFASFSQATGLDAWLRQQIDADPTAFGGRQAIHTTIVPAVQEAAARALKSSPSAVVAIDPATGHILAMASAPDYDPNPLADPDTTAATWRNLQADPNRPLSNRATGGILTAPGDVFQVVTAAAALTTGRYTAGTQLPGPAALTLPQTTTSVATHDRQPCSATGVTTLADALRTSCTTAFAALGMTLGAQALRDQADAFGIDRAWSIPVKVQPGSFPNAASPREVAWTAVGGFDLRITPLQLAMIGSGIANKGKVAAPTLLADEPDAPGPGTSPLTATTPEVADALTTMLRSAVASGQARDLAIPGVKVAGLVGDVQSGATGVSWATAFASAAGRSIVVAVAVQTPSGQPLSTQAAAVARDVIGTGLGADARR
jgi:peptidoglycan glycosyltransferase